MRRTIVLSAILIGVTAPAAAKTLHETPCGFAADDQPFAAKGLIIVEGGLVYDANQQVCWLRDANLAGNPAARAAITLSTYNPDGTVPHIAPDGTMDWQTARNWVDALNQHDHGRGWLGRNDWQLPTNPHDDGTCSSRKSGDFGVLCTGSPMGHLYNDALGIRYPDSVVPRFHGVVPPFTHLQPGLYWTGSLQGDTGYDTFSFNSELGGANTPAYNFLHVLPLTRDVLGVPEPRPAGAPCAVVPYVAGPGAGKAVFDSCTGLSWPRNANLAAHDDFGFAERIQLTSNVNGMDLHVSVIERDGAMHLSALCDLTHATPVDPCPSPDRGWLVSMNGKTWAGSAAWMLPSAGDASTPGDLDTLFRDLGLQPGDPRLEWEGSVGPFERLQPGFYWACERDPDHDKDTRARCRYDLAPCDPNGNSCSPCPGAGPGCMTCDPALTGAGSCVLQQYSFNFDDGFEGTDHFSKLFYVMVYYPAPRFTPQ